MTKYNILNRQIFFDPESTFFFLEHPGDSVFATLPRLTMSNHTARNLRVTCYSFCIDVSDACNLRCDYCFNPGKTGQKMNSQQAISYLESLFDLYPDGEKYFVDMSGKGEPLLALNTVLQIADWCRKKQNEIHREILPQFVCNGTLLSKEIASVLQKHGILFGVSLDGNQLTHDKHRLTAKGEGTFDFILNNIQSIPNRDYIGCACTLTNDVFDLVASTNQLLKWFKTISYRPARGDQSIDIPHEKLWEKEFDKLAVQLLEDIRHSRLDLFLALMNGEDYFGRFLFRVIGNKRVFTRCDASISRFAIDTDGSLYPCPSSSYNSDCRMKGSSAGPPEFSLDSQIGACSACPFKTLCGGPCPIFLLEHKKQDIALCRLTIHLILLSGYISETLFRENPSMHLALTHFIEEKRNRMRIDKRLLLFQKEHPELNFTEAKHASDNLQQKY